MSSRSDQPPVGGNLPHPKYRSDVDGLRAIAILSVLGFHAFPHAVTGGFTGVDVFFVISGFLISSIILRGLERDAFSFAEFYARRIKRIFPALALVLVSCLVFGWFALFADEYRQLGKHVAGGAGFISNFLFWNESGYFDNAATTKPLLHLWSLAIEEQFYLVWPFIVWFAWRKKTGPLTAALAIGGVSFAASLLVAPLSPEAVFYSPVSRFWELLAGSVLAIPALRQNNAVRAAIRYAEKGLGGDANRRAAQSALGAAMIAAGILIVTRDDAFPGVLLPVVGAMLMISAGDQAWFNRALLSRRMLVWLGLVSYPLYLWHWPLLSFATIIEGQTPSVATRVIALLLAVLLAWLTYRLIERPIRWGNRSALKAGSLALVMSAAGCAGFAVYEKDGIVGQPQVAMMEKVNSEFVGAKWQYMQNEACLKRYPFKDASSLSWWFCMTSKDQNPTLLLLGNSYANHLYPGLAKNAGFAGHSILSIGDCGAGWAEAATGPRNGNPCSGNGPLEQQQLINGIVEKTRSVRFAILNGLKPDPDAAYIANVKKRIDFLERNHVKVVVFIPHLRLDYDIRACYPRPLQRAQKSCEVSLADYRAFLRGFDPLVESLSKSNPDVAFFNQNELFCDDKKCSMIRDGMPLYRDVYDHLSEYGSIELSYLFEKWARKNVPEMF